VGKTFGFLSWADFSKCAKAEFSEEISEMLYAATTLATLLLDTHRKR